ncbi:MAG: oligosaccharide flippase family protein [Anaerolineales bacterium]|nr:oligosaccharide flippase family protein [Anaerolineales bacterium]
MVPDDFGIITMFSSVMALVMVLQQAGLMETTVQREQDSDKVREAAFWMSNTISLMLYGILYILAPLLSAYFGEDRLTLPLRVAGLQIILAGFSNIPLALLQRQFQYQRYALIQLVSSLIMIVAAALFAIQGKGYWAYIVGILSGAAVRVLLTLFFLDWRPKFIFEFHWWGVAFKFSGFVTLEMLLGWFFSWFDNVIVAKNLGSDAAGIYSLAFNFALMVISLPLAAITGVTLSTFSRMQNDSAALKATYLKATEFIASYAIPASIGFSIIGPLLIDLIYPGRYAYLGTILPILALYAGFGHLWALNSDAFKAIGAPQIMLKIYVLAAVIMLPLYVWASRIGLFEFVIVRSLLVFVGAVPHTYYAVRYLNLRNGYLFDIIRKPLFASMIMAIFVWAGTRVYFGINIPSSVLRLGFLLGIIVMGLLVYWLCMLRISPGFHTQIVDLYSRSKNAV